MSNIKKTAIATAVAAVTLMSSTAFAAEKQSEKPAVDVYGVIAMQAAYRDYDSGDAQTDENLSGVQFNNESRIGFRGEKQFANIAPTFFWQVESGYVDPAFGGTGAEFGERDTFVGFKSDEMGQVRVGRVLTPLYELVDWPASNPGLGDVYDWGGAIGGAKYQDRQSNTVRWDSPKFADALTFDVAAGTGDDAKLGTGSDFWAGVAAHYSVGPLQFDAAYEGNRETQFEGSEWDNNTYLVGVQGWFDNGVAFYAQYKMMEAETLGLEEKQNATSVGVSYTHGDFQYKLGYAANFDLEQNGTKVEDSADEAIAAQVLYFADPSAVIYTRARLMEFGEAAGTRWKSNDFTEFSVGVEYYF